jgi:hypothetical protein
MGDDMSGGSFVYLVLLENTFEFGGTECVTHVRVMLIAKPLVVALETGGGSRRSWEAGGPKICRWRLTGSVL